MRVQELGELTGDVLVFGGPYSNLQATQALITKAKRHGIGPANCICTGDVVAYCADAAATVAAIRDFGCPVVAGNCEKQLAEGAADCGCGFEAGTMCDALSSQWYDHADQEIDEAQRHLMDALPDLITFTHCGRRIAVVHGGVTDVARFLWPVSATEDFSDEIAAAETSVGPVDTVLAGHCGIAFFRQIGARRWINAGAIGMPPHDGRAETRYALLSGDGVVFHRLFYDYGAARYAMEQAGLKQGYHAALTSGVWPSEDVLPVALRRGSKKTKPAGISQAVLTS